jgi:hypothetical protein
MRADELTKILSREALLEKTWCQAAAVEKLLGFIGWLRVFDSGIGERHGGI